MPQPDPSEKDDEEDLEEQDLEDEDEQEDEEDEAPKGAEKLKSALVKERKARKTLAKELRQLRADLKTAQSAAKAKDSETVSEADQAKGEALRLKTENEALAKKIRTQALRTAVLLEASAMNFHNPKAAYKLLDDETLESIDVDDEGEVDADAVQEALAELAKDNKYLLKPKQSKSEDEDEDEEDASRGAKKPTEIGGGKGGRVTRQSKEENIKTRIERLRETGQYAG